MTADTKTLKEGNVRWLVSLLLVDALAFFAPVSWTTVTEVTASRALSTAFLPIVVLIATNLIPAAAKDILIFWRFKNALPGHRAFTKYGPADPRISMRALITNVGPLPTDEAEQNPFWYALYRRVKTDPAIVDSHRMFVLFRDMAVLSLLITAVTPVAGRLLHADKAAAWGLAAVFALQYLAIMLAARNRGIRLVCNVLAIHSSDAAGNS